jgi:outer membrane immunogenic protein
LGAILKILFAAAGFLAISAATAFSADLPVKTYTKAPVPIAYASWTGFYVGVNAGYSTQSNHVSLGGDPGTVVFLNDPTRTFGAFPFDTTTSGFLGGGQIGANYQVSPLWVLGIEADIQGGNVRARYSNISAVPVIDSGRPPPATFTTDNEYEKKLIYLGTVRGRVGWLVAPNLLLYATGGLAYGQVDTSAATNIFVTNSRFRDRSSINTGTNSETRVGWTAGLGGEWRFAGNWSVKGEYLYYDLGTTNVNAYFQGPLFGNPPIYTTFSSRMDGHIARVGLNYSFYSPAVVAKY